MPALEEDEAFGAELGRRARLAPPTRPGGTRAGERRPPPGGTRTARRCGRCMRCHRHRALSRALLAARRPHRALTLALARSASRALLAARRPGGRGSSSSSSSFSSSPQQALATPCVFGSLVFRKASERFGSGKDRNRLEASRRVLARRHAVECRRARARREGRGEGGGGVRWLRVSRHPRRVPGGARARTLV